jgi:hypothetical protein
LEATDQSWPPPVSIVGIGFSAHRLNFLSFRLDPERLRKKVAFRNATELPGNEAVTGVRPEKRIIAEDEI